MSNNMYSVIESEQTRLDIEEIRDVLESLPENMSMFKCHECKHIFDIHMYNKSDRSDKINGNNESRSDTHTVCPICNSEHTELMCKVDCYSVFLKEKGIVQCRKEDIIPKVDICPVCGDNMCPQCFNHNCISLSRVTGYIQDVSGWNVGKKAELLDRKRYDIQNVHMT